MPPIVADVDIARPPGEVFAYVTDPSRFGEWQSGVVSAHTEGPEAVGSKCIMTRRIGGSDRTSTSEITDYSPPRTWAIRGIDGPIRAVINVAVTPRDDGRRSHVTLTVDFTGHGFGKMILPMVIRQAGPEVAKSSQNLKKLLENGPA